MLNRETVQGTRGWLHRNKTYLIAGEMRQGQLVSCGNVDFGRRSSVVVRALAAQTTEAN